jgi:diguanylate cyclase (GGDEF)-like protein
LPITPDVSSTTWYWALPLVRELSGWRRRVVLGLFAALLAMVAAHVAFAGFGLGRGTLDTFFNEWEVNAAFLTACALCAARAALVPSGGATWWALAAGATAWSLGNVYWTVAVSHDPTPPFPSLADGGYLAFYPAAYVCLGLELRRSVQRLPLSLWLDGIVGGITVAALGAALVVAPILAAVGGSVSAVVVNAAYPLADLLLLSIVIAVFALAGWRPGRAWLALGVGFVGLAIADSAYLLRVATDSYAAGTVLDSLWVISLAVLAVAAWQPPAGERAVKLDGWSVLLPPLLFTVSAVGLLLAGGFTPMSPFALVLAGLGVLAGMVRVGLTFREVRQLAESRHQALTDELTGLPNRRRFMRELHGAIARADARGERLALLMIDLDHFKELNDTLGHHAGDLLLAQIGPRLAATLRSGDLLARLGGDEFAVLVADADAAGRVAERLVEALQQRFVIQDIPVHIAASVGVAVFPDHAENPDSLLRRADVAMYQAKAAQRGPQLYAPERDEHTRDRLAMITELRDAIANDELVLHYQPLVSLDTGATTAVEALVRWQHPTRGLLAPGEFIALAEQTGVMRPLTLHILKLALGQVRHWRDAHGVHVAVAVNVSATNVLDDRFAEDVRAALACAELDPSALILEVTENIVMGDPARAMAVLTSLSKLGIRVALDDYGTGYSSLAQLKRLAVDELKIDRSFVTDMHRNDDDAAIVRSTIELAHSLKLRVVAEGVEHAESLDLLRALGAERAQGYYLSRPLPPERLLGWLQQQRNTTPSPSQAVDFVLAPRQDDGSESPARKSAPTERV